VLRGLLGAGAALLAALVIGLAASGCGTVGLSEAGEGSVSNGKQLFTAKCGQCHVLADAGTKGVIGPNLDNAFVQSRADGLGESTIRSVVRGQIAYPVQEPSTGSPGMPGPDTLLPECDDGAGEEGAGGKPQGCVADQDDAAEDIAAYVASVAGKPTTGAPAAEADTSGSAPKAGAGEGPDGEAIFAQAGCGGCHTLKAAGSSGNVGPNLDDAKPPKELVIERVTKGMGAMPSFADEYTPDEIAAVADYVVASTGGR
jgi:mono/diheme cytochrome c family protein